MLKFPQRVFIAGIGTGVGKTLVSAVLAEALNADYWKPVQCGNLENSDSDFVRSSLSNAVSKVHSETYRFKTAASPHYAAQAENMEVKITSFQLPETTAPLVIEAAGGLLVPLNKKDQVIDLIIKLKTPVILVARNYLGSINHTLLSIDALGMRGINLIGLIYSGDNFLDNEQIIAQFSGVKTLGRVEEAESIDQNFVKRQAMKMRVDLGKVFSL